MNPCQFHYERFLMDFQEIDFIFVTIECIFGSDISGSTFSESIILKMNRNDKHVPTFEKQFGFTLDKWHDTHTQHSRSDWFTLLNICNTTIQSNKVLWQNSNSNFCFMQQKFVSRFGIDFSIFLWKWNDSGLVKIRSYWFFLEVDAFQLDIVTKCDVKCDKIIQC